MEQSQGGCQRSATPGSGEIRSQAARADQMLPQPVNVIHSRLPTESIELKRRDDLEESWKLGESATIPSRKDLPVLEMTNTSLDGGSDRGD
ncbi:MAG TPA: hypothetical protein VFX16_28820, partial [Pseudonocardiaceae bacterium]|nr:hypothetical protein [Pseudonocardiaceae bacterium]